MKYEETRRKRDTSSSKDSSNIYKRFSAHLPLEIPDIGGVMRETTNRVENYMGMNNGGGTSTQAELQRSHTTLH